MNKCYKCTTCENYYLCQDCFNLNIHNEHSFDYREVGDESIEGVKRGNLVDLETFSTMEDSDERTFNGFTTSNSSETSQSRYQ